MHFAFTDEQAMIAETAKAFFAEQATSERTRAAMAATGVDEDLWQAFTAELGLAGVAVPEAEGGVGLGMVELAILAEEAGRHVAALPLLASVGLAIPAVLAGGNAGQKARLLPRLAAGELVATFAEAAPGTTWIDGALTGAALHVPHGARAHLFIVAAGNAVLIVERDAPGLTVTPLTSMDQTRPMRGSTSARSRPNRWPIPPPRSPRRGAPVRSSLPPMRSAARRRASIAPSPMRRSAFSLAAQSAAFRRSSTASPT